MALTLTDVEQIARLARLNLSAGEETKALADLNRIFAMVEKMQAVDTDGIEPMAHPLEASLRLRDDAVTEPDRREALQSIAPESEQGFYLVPRVIE